MTAAIQRAKVFAGATVRSKVVAGEIRAIVVVATGWTTDPGPYDEAAILALLELTVGPLPDGLFDVVLSPTDAGAGAYLVAAYEDEVNGAVPSDFRIGNFGPGDVSEVQTGVALGLGGSGLFTIARSAFRVEAPGGIDYARES